MTDLPNAAASGTQAATGQQGRAPNPGAAAPERGGAAAADAADGGASAPAGGEQGQLSSAEVAKAATKALSAMGGGGRGGGSSFSSGLMIDGFHVPPHVVQALQELRLQAPGGARPQQPDPALQDLAAALAPSADAGREAKGPRSDQPAADAAPPDAAGSRAGGSSPLLSPPSSEAAAPDTGSPHCSSCSGRGRGSSSLAGFSSRCSSRSSGRHSSRSGGSGRSSASGRSGRSGAAGHAAGVDSESDEHVQGLEATVAELSARSAANAAVISQLNTDIVSLSTTNEALRQRLQLLTGQLRHRDVEIDNLRTDVRRLRVLMAGPIDNKAGRSSKASGGGSRA